MPIEIIIIEKELPAKKVYIAGPMSGILEDNYPAFYEGEKILQGLGLLPQNPAKNPKQESWEDYMRQAIILMMQCETVYMLPGWSGSRGALIEHNIARAIGMPVIYPENWCPSLPNPWEEYSK